MERKDIFKLGDHDATIIGPDIEIGQTAPAFILQNQDWQMVDILAETKRKVRVLLALPSLNTGVCDRETRTFNQAAAELSENIVVIGISTDLPFTQKSWCGAAGVERVLVLSDNLETDFGKKYGCLIKERRILRRAVFVIDSTDKVAYAAYMDTLGQEPDYEAVLTAAKAVLP